MIESLEHLIGVGSNSTFLFSEINRIALASTEELKPQMLKYDLKKDFSELYNNGDIFTQVFFYDKTAGKYTAERTNFNIDSINCLELQAAIMNYNLHLESKQREVVRKIKEITSIDERAYFGNNRVGSDLGYAHAKFFERSKSIDDSEDALLIEDLEEKGPFGGAFRDEFDYARFRGVKLQR